MQRAGMRLTKGAADKDHKNLNVELVMKAWPRLYEIADEFTSVLGLRKRLSLDETIARMIMTYPLAEPAGRKPAASIRTQRNGKARTA
jgi:hypothetical protein